jgi:hypothetical protein
MIGVMYEHLNRVYLFAVLIREACPIRSGWVEIIIVTGKKLIIWNQKQKLWFDQGGISDQERSNRINAAKGTKLFDPRAG